MNLKKISVVLYIALLASFSLCKEKEISKEGEEAPVEEEVSEVSKEGTEATGTLEALSQDKLNLECGTCGTAEDGSEYTEFANTFLLSKKEGCKYAPISLIDADPKTAWVEGAKGQGIGAEVIMPRLLNPNKPVKIWSGYGKSKSLFYANSRPKKIKITIIQGREDYGDAHDASGCGHHYAKLKNVAEQVVTLKDMNAYQKLPIPKFDVKQYKDFPAEYYKMDGTDMQIHKEAVERGEAKPFKEALKNYSYFLKIKILDVYKGKKYEDTCISEILN